jgi:hypothetical protein
VISCNPWDSNYVSLVWQNNRELEKIGPTLSFWDHETGFEQGTWHFLALFQLHRQLRMFSATRQPQDNIVWPRESIKFDGYAKCWFRRWHVRWVVHAGIYSRTSPSCLVILSYGCGCREYEQVPHTLGYHKSWRWRMSKASTH